VGDLRLRQRRFENSLAEYVDFLLLIAAPAQVKGSLVERATNQPALRGFP